MNRERHGTGPRVRALREDRGWTQAELARRADLSRAQVSAVETGRVVPSVAAGLALARALDTTAERLFGPAASDGSLPWAWPSPRPRARYWLAELDGDLRRYPVEPTAIGVLPHDGIAGEDIGGDVDAAGARDARGPPGAIRPERTLVLAGCDPAVGLLAAALLRDSGVRLLPYVRPSRRALELLSDGAIAVAGVHVGRTGEDNRALAGALIPEEVHLLRVSSWEAGVAVGPSVAARTARGLRTARVRWIVREEGSGARECLEEVFEGSADDRLGSTPCAADHRGVADAIRAGWADAGVCVRLVSEEAGLDFVPVRREAYDLCYPARLEDDPRIRALRDAVRDARFRRTLGGLPGYDVRDTGALVRGRVASS